MIHDGQIILILNLIRTQNCKWEKCDLIFRRPPLPREIHHLSQALSEWTLTEFNRYDSTTAQCLSSSPKSFLPWSSLLFVMRFIDKFLVIKEAPPLPTVHTPSAHTCALAKKRLRYIQFLGWFPISNVRQLFILHATHVFRLQFAIAYLRGYAQLSAAQNTITWYAWAMTVMYTLCSIHCFVYLYTCEIF